MQHMFMHLFGLQLNLEISIRYAYGISFSVLLEVLLEVNPMKLIYLLAMYSNIHLFGLKLIYLEFACIWFKISYRSGVKL